MLNLKKNLPTRITNGSANSKSRRGAATLEFALVLPILLILILGIIQIGRIVMLNQIATNAVREASRRAIIPGMSHAQVVAVANSYLDAGGISQTRRQVLVLDSAGNATSVEDVQSHEGVTIEVRIPYMENTWGFNSFGRRSLVSRSTMRRE